VSHNGDDANQLDGGEDPMMAEPREREAGRARARVAWADLRGRLATVTPAALGRVALTIVVLAVTIGMMVATWPALLPFVIGGLLAYTVLPVVNTLDRVMPRFAAAALSMLGIIAIVDAAIVAVVPPLVSAIIEVAGLIPSPSELDSAVEGALGDLPQESRDIIAPVLLALTTAVENGLSGVSGDLDGVIAAAFQAALNVAGAILGLLVLPTWLLTVMSGTGRVRTAVDRRLAGWLRADFWALVDLLDRAAGTYLRGFVVVALAIGALIWAALTASPAIGGPTFAGALAIAVFAGAVQLVPELGALLGFVPAFFIAVVSPERALVYVAVYVGARWLVGMFLGGRLLEDRLGVPRAILVPGVVVLSQVGPLALLLSAPILGFGSDLVRYAHGRLSEPPRPAGVLPGEPDTVAATAPPAVPAVYRRQATVGGLRSAPPRRAPTTTVTR
jgi:predicted PurR-regulated permease PerM